MQPPARGEQSCWQTRPPRLEASGGGACLPAGTRLHERAHSRCLKSPHLLICDPTDTLSGRLRQGPGLAQTCGENRQRRVRGCL